MRALMLCEVPRDFPYTSVVQKDRADVCWPAQVQDGAMRGSARQFCSCASAVLRAMASSARLDPFTRGVVWGMRAAGASREVIAATVKKKDGSRPSLRAAGGLLAKKRPNPH